MSHTLARPMSLTITSGWQSCPRCRSGSVGVHGAGGPGPERGHVWHWQGSIPSSPSPVNSLPTRRPPTPALILCNPGLTAPAVGATPTIAAAYQVLFPARRPRPRPFHLRHTVRARGQRRPHDHRRGPGADGPGDLILTPSWSWHGHVHPGGEEPVVWMDGLDVPFVLGLRRASSATTRTPATRCPSGNHGNRRRNRRNRRAAPAGTATDSAARSAATRGTRPTRPCGG